jgi:predicted ArsR family transcriptional regulator
MGSRTSARSSVVHLLKEGGELTVRAIADSLGVTTVAIRKHLDDLQREGLVETRRVPIPRGRPTIAYRLKSSDEVIPRTCGNLAAELLEELIALDGESTISRLIHARSDRLSRLYDTRLADKALLPDRMEEVARLRDQEGCQTVLEMKDGGFVLREQNCPIRGFAEKYPEACACEEQLLKRVLSKGIRRSGSVVDGQKTCEYHIDEETESVS